MSEFKEERYITSESVTKGHPDKLCDQISDAILDDILEKDPFAHVACEVTASAGLIHVMGEIATSCYVDIQGIARDTVRKIGYNSPVCGFDASSCAVITSISTQSDDIAVGVKRSFELKSKKDSEIKDEIGAGDQGIMYGYACKETGTFMPMPIYLAHKVTKALSTLRETRTLDYLYPDGKAQITGCYDDKGKLIYIKDFVVSYQNTEIDREDTDRIIKERCLKICHENDIAVEQFYFNPTGKFLIGGFEGDSGLTGRKICVDNYHSFVPIGGGAFSGKDPTKVDRSAAYKARQTALECLNEHPEVNNVLVQLSYTIGLSKPMAIYIKTDKGIIEPWEDLYRECEPNNIIEDMNLKNIDYRYTAQFGHFGVHGWYPKEIYKKYLPWEDEVKVIND